MTSPVVSCLVDAHIPSARLDTICSISCQECVENTTDSRLKTCHRRAVVLVILLFIRMLQIEEWHEQGRQGWQKVLRLPSAHTSKHTKRESALCSIKTYTRPNCLEYLVIWDLFSKPAQLNDSIVCTGTAFTFEVSECSVFWGWQSTARRIRRRTIDNNSLT